MPSRSFILASASPRRRELLTQAGYTFEIDPADIDESDFPPDAKPAEVAQYLAARKAEVVAARHPDQVTLASDTVVALGGTLYGKAVDRDDARRILRTLSGSLHDVITGVAVVCPNRRLSFLRVVTSAVQMRRMTEVELIAYLDSRLWEGKAGAYGIQDDDPFVTRIEGSLTNIMGLPMDDATDLLRQAGIMPISEKAD